MYLSNLHSAYLWKMTIVERKEVLSCDRESYQNKRISDPNSDIVGSGALAAFLVTATLTIIAVLFAYVSDTLDQDILNEIDRRCIARVQHYWRVLKYQFRRRTAARNAIPSGVGRNDAVHDRQREAITKFVLTLSDQQLITGLAILLAGLVNLSDVSAYELKCVLSLAWFSTTTHLATLDVLRKYFLSRGILRSVRVVGMLGVLGMVVYIFLLQYVAVAPAQPVQCLLQGSSWAKSVSNMNLEDALFFSGYVCVFAFVFWNYLIRIEDLYLQQRNPLYIATALGWTIWRPNERKLNHSTFVNERKATARARGARKVLQASGMRRRLRMFMHGLHLYNDSFLSSLPGIIFSYSFGIMNLISMRKYSYLWIPASALRLDFGQMVALFLLSLPFVAAVETYYDYHYVSPMPNERGGRHRHREILRAPLLRSLSAPDLFDVGRLKARDIGRVNRHHMAYLPDDLERRLMIIQKYFAKERRLYANEHNEETGAGLSQYTKLLLFKAIEIENLERLIRISLVVGIFAIQLGLAVLLAFLLNYPIHGSFRGSVIAAVFICFFWFATLLVSMVWDACVLWKDAKCANKPLKDFSASFNQQFCNAEVRMLGNAECHDAECASRHLQIDA